MLSTATFPLIFKAADITPIYKRGNVNDAKNYRPVTTLHNLSKVFERILLNRIINYTSAYSLLPPCQYGFRENHSTKDAILDLFLKIENNILVKMKTCCIFLDWGKAFDMVNHEKLLQILAALGFRGHSHLLFISYLTNRSFRIKHSNEYSKYCPILRGVPQGGILSPILYSLYVNNINSIHSNIILYADDSTIAIPYIDIVELQITLHSLGKKINDYFEDLHLEINSNKTEIILFGEKSSQHLNFLGEHIKTVEQTKFLGIVIHANRKFNSHIDCSILPNIRKLYSMFYHLSDILDNKTKRLLFQSSIIPYIIYATPFILNIDQRNMKKLSVSYKKALKILFRLPYRYPSELLFNKTHTMCPQTLIQNHTALYAHKIFNVLAPPTINSFFTRTPRRNFIIKPFKDNISTHNTIALHWNALKSDAKIESNFAKFKRMIMQRRDNT